MAGLPPAYNMITTVLMNSEKELALDDILPKLLHAEQMLVTERIVNAEATVLFTKPKPNNGGYRRKQGDTDVLLLPAARPFRCGLP